jgi:hypothetical protein
MAASSVSFALCLAYLLMFPFHVWGMATLIGIGTILVTIMGRPDDAMTTGITIAEVMVVAAVSPHDSWLQPVLRLVDTAVGVAVGIAAAWLGTSAMRVTKLSGRDNSPNAGAGGRMFSADLSTKPFRDALIVRNAKDEDAEPPVSESQIGGLASTVLEYLSECKIDAGGTG